MKLSRKAVLASASTEEGAFKGADGWNLVDKERETRCSDSRKI
jgi:hypothetical protein